MPRLSMNRSPLVSISHARESLLINAAASVRMAFSLFVVLTLLLTSAKASRAAGAQDFSTREIVGRLGTNRLYTPVNQVLTPAGLQVELPGLRPQALALSPDGRLLVTSGKTHELVVIDAHSARV